VIALDDIEATGTSYRVTMNVPVAGRTRRVTVTMQGRTAIDIQADDGITTWTSSAGDPETTEAAVSRAYEEVIRLKAIQQALGGRR
jgi:hypothetical protein